MESLPRRGWNISRSPRRRYIDLDPARDTHAPCNLSTFFCGLSLAVLALVSISVFGPQQQQHQPQQVPEVLWASAAIPQSAAAAAAAASIRVWNSYADDEQGNDYELQLYPWTHVAEPYRLSVLTIDAADNNGFEATVR